MRSEKLLVNLKQKRKGYEPNFLIYSMVGADYNWALTRLSIGRFNFFCGTAKP